MALQRAARGGDRGELLDKLAQVWVDLPQYRAADLANIAWALAKLVVHDAPLSDAIAAASIALLPDFRASDLSKSAWALARRLLKDCPLFDAIAAAAIPTIDQCTTPEISSFLWA